MIELCKDKPCYLDQCNHCRVSNGNWAKCFKTEEEQRKINLFIDNGHIVDELNREIWRDSPNMVRVKELQKMLSERMNR